MTEGVCYQKNNRWGIINWWRRVNWNDGLPFCWTSGVRSTGVEGERREWETEQDFQTKEAKHWIETREMEQLINFYKFYKCNRIRKTTGGRMILTRRPMQGLSGALTGFLLDISSFQRLFLVSFVLDAKCCGHFCTLGLLTFLPLFLVQDSQSHKSLYVL